MSGENPAFHRLARDQPSLQSPPRPPPPPPPPPPRIQAAAVLRQFCRVCYSNHSSSSTASSFAMIASLLSRCMMRFFLTLPPVHLLRKLCTITTYGGFLGPVQTPTRCNPDYYSNDTRKVPFMSENTPSCSLTICGWGKISSAHGSAGCRRRGRQPSAD